MGEVISLGGVTYTRTVDQVINQVKNIIDDGGEETPDELQQVSALLSLYELKLLINEIEHLRSVTKKGS